MEGDVEITGADDGGPVELYDMKKRLKEMEDEAAALREIQAKVAKEMGSGQDDEDEEFEEAGGGSSLLGFMFGNVDNSGDLDIDYLDEDVKEHLGALADKLGTSLTEISLSIKTPQNLSDAAEQDYDRKAEDAVDYEDIDEEYDGPEVQGATEEDFLLPKNNFFPTNVSTITLGNGASVFDDEDYDEDDESEKQHEVLESNAEVAISSEDLHRENVGAHSQAEKQIQDDSSSGDVFGDAVESESLDADIMDSEEEEGSLEEASTEKNRTPLPILYVEDGMPILRFSEIFGIDKQLKKAEKGERKYLIPKDMYMSTEAVEEDEEAFLKCTFLDVSGIRRAQVIQEKSLGRLDPDFDSEKFGVIHGSDKIDLGDNQRKDSCYSSELFRDDLSQILTTESNESYSPKFYPLEQLDWEDRIIWDNSPVLSNNSAESWEKSGSDVDMMDDNKGGLVADPCSSIPHSEIEFHNRPMLLEPFDSTRCLEPSNASVTGSYSHPQLLRLEARFNSDTLNKTTAKKDGSLEEFLQSDVVRCFDKLTLQNRDVFDGSWLDNIIWEPQQSISKPKLIFDLQDEKMLFEILDNKDSKHLQEHAGAMIVTRSVKANAADNLDVHGHGVVSGGRFNISNDKFYSNRKSSQQLKSHMKKRTAHGLKVLHSIPALKLQTMKAKLSNKDIANFHRPRALWYPHNMDIVLREQDKLPKQGPMKIILKSLGGKGCKLHVDTEELISSVKAKASKKLDFKLSEPVKIFYSGKELEDNSSLAAQNVRPNSLLHLIRTKVHLLPRAQKLPGENKSLRPPGAFKKKSDLSAKDGHIFLMEYCEGRPLLLGNVGMGARLCTYYQKSAPDDQKGSSMRNENSGLGSVIVLDPADKSPFLGDIKPGCSQSSLETNMYRAPIYQQKLSSTDYLLVRSAKGKLSIRRIDRIDVVGQQEPHMEVIAPGSKGVQTYIMNRLLVYLYREFRAVEKRGLRPSVHADELSAQFPSLSEAFLRKRLKHCADLQRGSNGQLLWVMRRNFRIPLEEELRRMVTPENVCSYESMQAGLYRLKRLGITKLTQPTGLLSAMNQLPEDAIALAAASHIERELQITPWNLSSNFVACTNQDRENIERLEITGVGDPSGRGLGFSFVRVTPKAPVSNAMVKKKAVVSKGTTVTGTDADLRRLSMDAAREVLLKFNVPEEQIEKLTRWHRIYMIRKLSSEQAATGVKVDSTTISKYARGQRISFTQLQQQTREKCQKIWERQVRSLSAFDGEENESDSEANSDLDSFAGDLENLLDAEECEDGGHASKHDAADGVKGLKMRRGPFQAQAEEEIEDEAALAAELCRMLMDDEEAERKKKKKARALVEQIGRTLVPQPKFGSESVEVVKKTANVFVKQSTQSDGNSLLKENLTLDEKEDDIFSAKRNIPGKVKPKKKNDVEDMDIFKKKVKILGDGIKIIKEKKSARESFVCGACGQLGHMRTNKNCPKYGEDQETRTENNEPEKASGKPNSSDQTELSQQNFFPKKIIPKTATKTAVVDVHYDDKSSSKGKVLKVKCGMNDKPPDKLTPATSQNSDKPATSDAEIGNRSLVKVSKITFSNKKTEDVQVEHKPSIVIRPPMEVERDQPRRKITIKRPKEVFNMDDESQEGSTGTEYRKTKKIVELSGMEKHRGIESTHFTNLTVSRKKREERRWFQEQEKWRIAEFQREERARRLYDERTRALEEQERLAEIRRYEEDIRREREEEERQKAKKKKKKNKRPEIRDDYLDDLPPRRNDRRIPERGMKRRPAPEVGRYVAGYVPPTKRRRGGEVGLSNILESIVDTLKDKQEVSFLFLKPVSKKEAPDYLKIIKRPMDLSTIRDKLRKLEYKSREEFRHDVWQITFNAHKYNDGRNPGIPPLADQLLELCDFLLEQNADSLAEAEAGIEYGDS